MAQRIVCRFCKWYVQFDSSDDYEQARDDYDEHLDVHIEEAKTELNSEEFEAVICARCKITHLTPHCEDLRCLWLMCTGCRVVMNEHGNDFTYTVKKTKS